MDGGAGATAEARARVVTSTGSIELADGALVLVGAGVPLWAGQRAVLGPLGSTGLDGLFDLCAPGR